MNTTRDPDTIHPPVGAYTHQVEVTGSPRWLVIAGQVGRTSDGKVPEDPIEQLKVALENIRNNLVAAGMDLRDIVKINWYLVGEVDPVRRRQATLAWLGEHRAASTLVYVSALASPQYRVEIEAWAAQ